MYIDLTAVIVIANRADSDSVAFLHCFIPVLVYRLLVSFKACSLPLKILSQIMCILISNFNGKHLLRTDYKNPSCA